MTAAEEAEEAEEAVVVAAAAVAAVLVEKFRETKKRSKFVERTYTS